MRQKTIRTRIAIASCFLVTSTASLAAAQRSIEEITRAMDDAQRSISVATTADDTKSSRCPDPAAIAKLDNAVAQGKEINVALSSELEDYKRVQTALTSGLVGALVTAIVAIAGAILTARNSRPERDMKRLAVIEKAREMQAAGIEIPDDIVRDYQVKK